MKIYTKTGDKGQTSLGSGERVSKASLRVDAYGTVDELNSHIGLLRTESTDPQLSAIQNELFNLGTHLATKSPKVDIKDDASTALEREMDRMTSDLPELRNFILPGGSRPAALAHICRTVCRRAERLVIALHEAESLDVKSIVYLNRLSDYFFVLARYLNLKANADEVIWKP